jgi:1,6-anhydro-N-acetylmuramate kinase
MVFMLLTTDLGRELFGDDTAQRMIKQMKAKGLTNEDCVATITRITAASIVDAYKNYGPGLPLHEIYFCGGGSYNPNM